MFDVMLVDIHNPKDNITIENQVVPESCSRRSVVGDYIRYHYNGTFLNGVTFDTRSDQITSLSRPELAFFFWFQKFCGSKFYFF